MTRQRESCPTSPAPVNQAPNHPADTAATCAAEAGPSRRAPTAAKGTANVPSAGDTAKSERRRYRIGEPSEFPAPSPEVMEELKRLFPLVRRTSRTSVA